jgi:hypothetical protein
MCAFYHLVVAVIASRFVGVAIQELRLFLLLFFLFWCHYSNGISVSGLPRATRRPRNDGQKKAENDSGNIETATPHPPLSRKGRGNDHDK